MSENINDIHWLISITIVTFTLLLLSILFGYLGKTKKNIKLKKYGSILFYGFSISIVSHFFLSILICFLGHFLESWWYLLLFLPYLCVAFKVITKLEALYNRFFK